VACRPPADGTFFFQEFGVRLHLDHGLGLHRALQQLRQQLAADAAPGVEVAAGGAAFQQMVVLGARYLRQRRVLPGVHLRARWRRTQLGTQAAGGGQVVLAHLGRAVHSAPTAVTMRQRRERPPMRVTQRFIALAVVGMQVCVRDQQACVEQWLPRLHAVLRLGHLHPMPGADGAQQLPLRRADRHRPVQMPSQREPGSLRGKLGSALQDGLQVELHLLARFKHHDGAAAQFH
jgi:hypothetical protein